MTTGATFSDPYLPKTTVANHTLSFGDSAGDLVTVTQKGAPLDLLHWVWLGGPGNGKPR